MKHLSKFKDFLSEKNNSDDMWSKDVEIKKGKLYNILNIPKDKKIIDVYTSGKELAKDLLKAVNGDKKKAVGMLAFPANLNKDYDIFDIALKHLDILDKEEK
jgi:hypothetical protein